jgi:hypothetical protein
MSARIIAWFFCSLISCLASPAQAARLFYSVSIGNNTPPRAEGVPALRYADDDAIRYYDLFVRAGARGALLTVMDRQTERRYAKLVPQAKPPTLAELRATLARYRAEMLQDRARGDEPVLVLTYSGHGSMDNANGFFLALVDGELTQDILYEEILHSFSTFEVHLIIDACHAGGVVGVRGAFDHESTAETIELTPEQRARASEAKPLERFPSVGVLIASASGQEAHEWSRIESGVFTHEIISALSGAADINGDLRIEYSEVQAFVAAANRDITDPRAVPEIVARPPASNPHAALVDLTSMKRTVLLRASAGELGRFTLTSSDGRRFVDAHLGGRSRVSLAIPDQPGTYLQQGDREAEIPSEGAVSFDALHFAKADIGSRGATLDRTLLDGLFASAYTRDYYRGFVDSHQVLSVDLAAQPGLPHDRDPISSKGSSIMPPWVHWSLLSASAAALATSVATAILAGQAKDDFESTNYQRRAHDLRDDYQLYSVTSIATAILGTAAGVGAYFTWPRETGSRVAGVSVRASF